MCVHACVCGPWGLLLCGACLDHAVHELQCFVQYIVQYVVHMLMF